jgi:uncharacterized protein YcfJ
MKIQVIVAGLAATALAACTTTGNVERNAAGGAALGALAGAAIGNNTGDGDAETGAIVGGALGAAAGAYRGYSQDQRAQGAQQAMQGQRYYDQRVGRYYYVDPQTGSTYWDDGSLRTR